MGAKVVFKWNKPIKQITDETIGGSKTLLFAATQWHRLYYPWIPADTMMLSSNVDYSVEGNSGIIHHKVPYAHKMYEGEGFNFRKDKHPLAQAHWDNGAKQAGKGAVLAKMIEAYIKRGG